MDGEVELCPCHGEPMYSSTRTNHRTGKTIRRRYCKVKAAEYRKKYPKEKLEEARRRYRDRHVRVHFAGTQAMYPVRPERKEELVRQLKSFRAQQREKRLSVK